MPQAFPGPLPNTDWRVTRTYGGIVTQNLPCIFIKLCRAGSIVCTFRTIEHVRFKCVPLHALQFSKGVGFGGMDFSCIFVVHTFHLMI